MHIGAEFTFVVRSTEDLADCFDATCAEVFATSCHLVAGDRDRAEELMIDVYLGLHRAVSAGASVTVDHDWIVSTALRQVLGHQPDGGNEALTALEQAALELHLVDGRDIDSVARMLGLTSAEVIRSIARYDDDSQFSADLVADLLQRSELWLDDTTRRRARAAMRRGERPPRPPIQSNEPLRQVPTYQAPRQAPHTPTAPDDAFPSPRRTIIAAVCAVIALIGVGAVWILPSDETPTTAPGTPVSAAPADEGSPVATDAPAPEQTPPVVSATTNPPAVAATSAPGASTGDAPGAPVGQDSAGPTLGSLPAGQVRAPVAAPGFVLGELPQGFEPNGASEQIQPAAAGRFELWAERGASRTDGRWLALSTMTYTPSRTAILPGASRETIADNPAVLVTAPDGVSVFTVQPVSGGQFSLAGGGYSNDELRQLASAVTLRRGEPVFDPAVDTLRTGLEPLVSAPSRFGDLASHVAGGERRWTTYLSDDQTRFITVTSRTTTPHDLLTSEFLLPPSSDTLAPQAPARTLQMSDREVLVSGAPTSADGARSESSISWHEGDETVTISGNTGLHVLLAAIPSVRRATAEEWSALFQFDPADLPRAEPQRLRGNIVRIGRTTFADTSRWTISMSDNPVGVRFEVRSDSAAGIQGETVFASDPPTPLQEYVSMSSTLLVIAIADPRGATGVRFSLAGSNPVNVPLVPVDGAGLFAAGYAFSDIAPYTVELVDPTGATVESLNP